MIRIEDLALRVAGAVFLVVAILHLARFVLKLPFRVGDMQIPLSASVLGFAVGLLLAILMFKAGGRKI